MPLTSWSHYGEAMAILAAWIFAFTSILFTIAGQRLSVTMVNLFRVVGGALCLSATHRVLFGSFWPEGLALGDQVWIGLSGIAGLAIGDSALFSAFTRIGPRRSMMLMATAPVFTVITAWFLLAEHLGTRDLLTIALIICGVLLAVSGREKHTGAWGGLSTRQLRTGYLLGLAAAAGQGLGSTFVKLGMTGGVDPLGATLVRMVWAMAVLWVFVAPRRSTAERWHRLADRRGLLALGGAILLGPFISVWISIIAIKHASTGIAQAFLGTVPIWVILPSWIFYRDRPSVVTLLGVLVAVGGGALLFLL
jgi:drug/metabolite transporter (DMT)-like permease